MPEEFLSILLGGVIHSLGTFAVIWEKREGDYKPIYASTREKDYPDLCKLFRGINSEARNNLTPSGQEILKRTEAECDADTKRRIEGGFSGVGYKSFYSSCHLGLRNSLTPIEIDGHVVAVLVAGKIVYEHEKDTVIQNIRKLGFGESDVSTFESVVKKAVKNQTDVEMMLKAYDAQCRLLNTIVHRHYKSNLEAEGWSFRIKQGSSLNQTLREDGKDINEKFRPVLEEIREYFRVSYVAVFCSTQRDMTYLPLVAQAGIETNLAQKLRFNWRKALLSMEDNFDSHEWLENTKLNADYPLSFLERGCKGQGADVVHGSSFLLPYIYGNHYRGVFLLGPYSSNVLGNQETRRVTLRREIGYSVLSTILSSIINSALSQRDNEIEKLNRLWAHTIRTELHHGLFGEVSIIDGTLNSEAISKEARERARLSVNRIKDTLRVMKIQTRFAKETQEAAISNLIDPKELRKERYSLLFLVQSCVERMEQSAKQAGMAIVVDESLDNLYSVEIDVRLMTIVIENIIDNAIKYAKKGEEIRIHGEIDVLRRAVVRIENYGRGIYESDQRQVFDLGYRGRNVHDRDGAGLGLYQVQNIVKSHGGEVSVSSRPAYKDALIHSDFITTIAITLPMKLS